MKLRDWFAAVVLFLGFLPFAGAAGPTSVFETAAPAECDAPLKEVGRAADGPLRRLVVEERMGRGRSDELVRVPVFFHPGECRDLAGLAIVAADDPQRRPLVVQADDIRRDAKGKISRVHLYFEVNLKPWQRKEFLLVRGQSPAAPPLRATKSDDLLIVAGDELTVVFWAAGAKQGAVAELRTAAGAITAADKLLAPEMTLVRQAADCKVLRSTKLSWREPEADGVPSLAETTEARRQTARNDSLRLRPDTKDFRELGTPYGEGHGLEIRDFRYGTGPLFAKVIVRAGPKGVPDSAEFIYRVPARGTALVQTERLLPEEKDTDETVGAAGKDHALLCGQLHVGNDEPAALVTLPAGIRRQTRATQPHTNTALVWPKQGLSLLPVPYVQTGVSGVTVAEDGAVRISGSTGFQRKPDGNSQTLRAFWSETRYVVSPATTEDALWELSCRHFQPLVAVVEEPALTIDDFRAQLPEVAKRFFEIKYWGRGWIQTGCMHQLARDEAALTKLVAKNPKDSELMPEAWMPAWTKANEPPPPGLKIDAGRADPYGITYGVSGLAGLAAFDAPGERLDRVALAVAQASRRTNGRVEPLGFPYITCFATALNMQIGSGMLGLYAGQKLDDAATVRFYRDALRTPAIRGVYGHGQRTYTGNITGAAASDLLYQCISDYELRLTELYANEDLEIHPAAMARYFDCVDVTADLCHRAPPGGKRRSWHRANFFRGQAHDHRWESWSCAPLYGMFAKADDAGRIGLTEGCRWLRHVSAGPINWSELMWYYHADVMLRRGLAAYRPPKRLPLPGGLKVAAQAAGVQLAWQPVAGAVGYNVYRAERAGGPWTWLNSPYVAEPLPPVSKPQFADKTGAADKHYFVTAVVTAGRESRWEPDEPLPGSGRR